VSMVTPLLKLLTMAGPGPHCVNLTLLPFRGYWLYDGLLRGAAPPLKSKQRLLKRKELRRKYHRALDHGTFKGICPSFKPTVEKKDPSTTREPEQDVDAMLADLLRDPRRAGKRAKIAQLPTVKDGWVFRRFGYSARENPNKFCAVLAGSGAALGVVNMASLSISVDEVLDFLAQQSSKPEFLALDDQDAVNPSKPLCTPCSTSTTTPHPHRKKPHSSKDKVLPVFLLVVVVEDPNNNNNNNNSSRRTSSDGVSYHKTRALS